MPEKLTPGNIEEKKKRIEKEVKAFKKRAEGLNPKMFIIPEEEKEKELEVPEELILIHQIKQGLEEKSIKLEDGRIVSIEEGTKQPIFIENALKEVKNNILLCQEEKKTSSIWWILRGYNALLQFNISAHIQAMQDGRKKRELLELWQSIEENIKDPATIESVLEEIENDILQGQEKEKTDSAWWGLWNYVFLLQSEIPKRIQIIKNGEKKQKLSELWQSIKENAQNPVLIENVLKKTKDDIIQGQKEGMTYFAWLGLRGYNSLLQSKTIKQIQIMQDGRKKRELLELWQNIEESVKNPVFIKNVLEETKNDILQGQEKEKTDSAWWGLWNYVNLTFFTSHLKHLADQKMKTREHQKALHPKKEIPPRPEFPTF